MYLFFGLGNISLLGHTVHVKTFLLTTVVWCGDGGAVDHFNAREAAEAELQSEKEVGWRGRRREKWP